METGDQTAPNLAHAKTEAVANLIQANACALQAGKIYIVRLNAKKVTLALIAKTNAHALLAKDATMSLVNACLALRALMDWIVPKNAIVQATEQLFACTQLVNVSAHQITTETSANSTVLLDMLTTLVTRHPLIHKSVSAQAIK